MSEPTNANAGRCSFRLQLLTSVSALALLTSICGAAKAEEAGNDMDRPMFWIELGWQFEKVGGGQQAFAPPFEDAVTQAGFTSPGIFEKKLPYSYGPNGKFSFQPEDSDWIFSASLHYGRTTAKQHIHEQTSSKIPLSLGTITAKYATRYSDTVLRTSETHAIVDFQAGKDVRLGLFGHDSFATMSLGVRFANFGRKSKVDLMADPDYRFHSVYFPYAHASLPGIWFHHVYAASARIDRSFSGLGPSISWDVSTKFFGEPRESELTFDWGVNAAVLFGRQKANVDHETQGAYYKNKFSFTPYYSHHYQSSKKSSRRKSLVVPNLGGFAGFSLRFPNAKVSLGYRADVFFGAMDGGIDTRKSYSRGFYGPFASVSVGLGG